MTTEGTWGGARKGAGRPKGSTKAVSNARKKKMISAHEDEYELIKQFIALVRKDKEKAAKLLTM